MAVGVGHDFFLRPRQIGTDEQHTGVGLRQATGARTSPCTSFLGSDTILSNRTFAGSG